jgi:benzylsuccinate CoA-transferase BbsE subunit
MTATGALQPYRILDLTTHRGWLAGKLLADLGAEVTKVEPPGGDPGRRLAPFADDDPDPEKALGWWAYNRGKRSVTLDLAAPRGRDLFLKLAAQADAVLESFEPGQMEAWGLGLDSLKRVNPRIVLTRITPFGQTGPYARLAASDLILSALGGSSWLVGDEDRPPARVSAPQFFLHAGAEAALHTAVCLFHADSTGEGQEVDVSAQAATVRTLLNAFTHAYTDGRLLRRERLGKPSEYTPFPSLFTCSDGCVIALVRMGAGFVGFRTWAREEGDEVPAFFEAISDEELSSRESATLNDPKVVALLTTWLEGFFAKRAKAAVVSQGVRRKLMISGVNTLADILADEQLEARGYYQPVRMPGREAPVRHPGVWAHLTGTPLANTPAAPRIGEHNVEVWRGEAGLDAGAFEALRGEGAI